MSNSKYTFLLPAYKAKYFEKALSSIKLQTYKEFKVIVSDDCSPEDLESIYNNTVGDDSRFMYRRNKENMGSKSLVSHWNMLVDICDTEYLIIASDDDVYEPNFIEEADKLLLKYPNVNLLRGRSRCIDSGGDVKGEENIMDEWMDKLHFIHRIYQYDWVGGVASFIYKTKFLKSIGKFVDFPLAWFSDDVTNFLMADNGCCTTHNLTFNVRNSDIQISSQWGNSVDAKNKILATYMNHRWMKMFMSQFSNYKDYQLVKQVTCEYKCKICSNIQNYIYHCNILDFFNFIIQCPNDLELSKFRMIAHYFRYKIHI